MTNEESLNVRRELQKLHFKLHHLYGMYKRACSVRRRHEIMGDIKHTATTIYEIEREHSV